MNPCTAQGRCGTVGSAFEEVAFKYLQVGVKYKIKDFPEQYSHYSGIFKEQDGAFQVFEHVMYHGPFGSYKEREFHKIYFVHKFYYGLVRQKEKIQQAMEKRALHIILRSVLDDYFVWE